MSELYEKIYAVVRRIPSGKVATYGQVARLAGMGSHARLVGYALHALTPEKKVPWHRVVGASGKISLGGEGSSVQRQLLESEGVDFDEKGKIRMAEFGWSRQG
ncbi:MAG: MGMT family protein [Anaerolineales bacterium]|nr:MGMT family protein [Anaerolineales bacterium]